MATETTRCRARDLGIQVGILPPAPLNAITDVPGVRVGHHTVWKDPDIRTGVTVIVPHPGNLFREKVPGAVYCGNAFGKLAGSTQVEELGVIETPVVLTNTLSVGDVVSALVRYTLEMPGNEAVLSVNALVGETNDGYLNDIRGQHVTGAHVMAAMEAAASGPVPEGTVGAGTGTSCFGFKGGIGTASRQLPGDLGGYTLGVLIQTNYGGILTINGAPVGRELGQFSLSAHVAAQAGGSCMIVVATDAPLEARNLRRLAKRALFGLARTGSYMENGSGDYAIAFSTANQPPPRSRPPTPRPENSLMPDARTGPLFLAAVEATEEAVYNSMFRATTVVGRDGHRREAIDLDRVRAICSRYGVLHLQERLPGIPAEIRSSGHGSGAQ